MFCVRLTSANLVKVINASVPDVRILSWNRRVTIDSSANKIDLEKTSRVGDGITRVYDVNSIQTEEMKKFSAGDAVKRSVREDLGYIVSGAPSLKLRFRVIEPGFIRFYSSLSIPGDDPNQNNNEDLKGRMIVRSHQKFKELNKSSSRVIDERMTIDFQEQKQSKLQCCLDDEWTKASNEFKNEENPYHLGYHHGLKAAKAIFIKKIAHLEDDLELVKVDRLKEIIMPIMRTEFEEFEQLHLPAVKLSKDDMIKNLQQTDPNFSIPSSIMKVEQLSLHYVSMRYILKNCTDRAVLDFKKFLISANINDDLAARVGGIFYKKSSMGIHNILLDITVNDVEVGLRKNGITQNDILYIVKLLFAIQRGKLDELKLYE